jgi:hypothetical protein
MNTLLKIRLLLVFIIFTIGINYILAGDISEQRKYEPVVLRGGALSHFYDVPVSEIYLYSYTESTQSYQMMPFQIDERILADDPFNPGNEKMRRHSYFIADDGLLDNDDEIVFLIRDLGEKAPIGIWINNEEAKQYQRLEVTIYDPNDHDTKAYCYLFRSSTIQEQVPNNYGFVFHAQQDSIETSYYAAGFSKENGVIEDIVLKPPFGNGFDIFDTQKIRFEGIMEYGGAFFPFPFSTENDVIRYSYHNVNKNPVVRLIWETRMTLIDSTLFGDFAFYVTPKFYPFNATISGGMLISEQAIRDAMPIADDVWIHFDLLRQSWDFNENAIGMEFFNSYNNGVPIDGNPDQANKTISFKPDPELPPIREWMLTTGTQGSFFTYAEFIDTTWQTIELFFEDNNTINPDDTGEDQQSFGDQGILFLSQPEDSINFELGFTAYFLPSSFTKSDAEQLAYYVENPIAATLSAISFPTGVEAWENTKLPRSFKLLQNFPNPFNSSTNINFYISQDEKVTLEIVDITGRTIAILADRLFSSGSHIVNWDGKNHLNQETSSGVYFYILQSESFSDVKKLILLR